MSEVYCRYGQHWVKSAPFKRKGRLCCVACRELILSRLGPTNAQKDEPKERRDRRLPNPEYRVIPR